MNQILLSAAEWAKFVEWCKQHNREINSTSYWEWRGVK